MSRENKHLNNILFVSKDDIISYIRDKIHLQTTKLFFICDFNVYKHHKKFVDDLTNIQKESKLSVLSISEKDKTREKKALIEDELLFYQFSKNTMIIAIGGGVVSDLSGFVAATYCRGIPWICIPTTLLGMIDASIGGKTGVNTIHGKNLIGAFHNPSFVFICYEFLSSLPTIELNNGLAEVIKYGCIHNKSLLEPDKKLDLSIELIHKCIESKNHFIRNDFRDSGIRKHLNFGHTVAHAIETITSYIVPHGKAVAFGMIIEGKILSLLEILPQTEFDRLSKVIFRVFDLKFESFLCARRLYPIMCKDKKNLGEKPVISKLSELGGDLNLDDFIEVRQNILEKAIKEVFSETTCCKF